MPGQILTPSGTPLISAYGNPASGPPPVTRNYPPVPGHPVPPGCYGSGLPEAPASSSFRRFLDSFLGRCPVGDTRRLLGWGGVLGSFANLLSGGFGLNLETIGLGCAGLSMIPLPGFQLFMIPALACGAIKAATSLFSAVGSLLQGDIGGVVSNLAFGALSLAAVFPLAKATRVIQLFREGGFTAQTIETASRFCYGRELSQGIRSLSGLPGQTSAASVRNQVYNGAVRARDTVYNFFRPGSIASTIPASLPTPGGFTLSTAGYTMQNGLLVAS